MSHPPNSLPRSSPNRKSAEQPRVRVFAVDGQELSPSFPWKVRRMMERGIAQSIRLPDGAFAVQMTRPVGAAVPHG